MESRRKGRRVFAWKVATARPTACFGKAPVYPSTPARASTRLVEPIAQTHLVSTRGLSLVLGRSWCKVATPADARPANGNARRRFASC